MQTVKVKNWVKSILEPLISSALFTLSLFIFAQTNYSDAVAESWRKGDTLGMFSYIFWFTILIVAMYLPVIVMSWKSHNKFLETFGSLLLLVDSYVIGFTTSEIRLQVSYYVLFLIAIIAYLTTPYKVPPVGNRPILTEKSARILSWIYGLGFVLALILTTVFISPIPISVMFLVLIVGFFIQKNIFFARDVLPDAKQCISCGEQIKVKAKFCDHCGKLQE